MILLVVLVLLVLLVGVAVVGGATGLAGGAGRRDGGTRLSAALAVPAAVAAVVMVLFAVTVLGLVGARSGREPAEDADSDAAETAMPVEEDEVRGERGPVALEGPPATFDGRVSITQGASPLRPLPIVGGLDSGDVIEVRGYGFLSHAEGVLAQCSGANAVVCRNVAPILTDGEGRLRVPYRVEGRAGGDVLVVEVDFDRGAARLAFGATPASPVLSTEGSRVAILGAPPGERVTVRRCGPRADTLAKCSAVSTLTVAADGTASAPLGTASVGAARLTLVDAAGNVLAEPVRVKATRTGSAEVELEATRLLLGFAVALLLVGAAAVLIRTTDWRVPAEAATPFLDAAPLEP